MLAARWTLTHTQESVSLTALTYTDKLGEKKHQPDNEEAALQAHRVEDQQAEANTGQGG